MAEEPGGGQLLPALERIPYPSHGLLKHLFKSPILLWRLGMGFVVGRLFMIMTTSGRRSGRPRRTAIEYHTIRGRKYVLAAWPKADWYQNLVADPRLTIQTADGEEFVVARRLTSDEELKEAFQVVEENPMLRRFWRALGSSLSLEDLLRRKDHFYLITFDPAPNAAVPSLRADLTWVWPPVLLAIVGGIWRALR